MTHRIERTMVGTIPGTLHKSLRALTSRRVTCPTRVNTCRVRPNLPRGLPVLVRSAGFELFPPTPVGGSPVLRLHRVHFPFYFLFSLILMGGELFTSNSDIASTKGRKIFNGCRTFKYD